MPIRIYSSANTLEPEQISPADPLAETSGCKQFGLGLAEFLVIARNSGQTSGFQGKNENFEPLASNSE
jgi:hypothetical protein